MAKRGSGLSMTSAEEGTRILREYYETLGSFVSAYARTEGLVHLALRILAGLSDRRGSALLSGVRADHAVSLIKRILDATGRTAMADRLARHFQQFTIITRIRNDILHYGAEFETEDVLLISNERDAHIPARLQETRIEPRDLRRMNLDLQVIRCGLLAELDRGHFSASEQQTWDERARAPWQYRPPPRASPHRKTQKNSPKRRRRPPSSPG